LNVSTRTTFKVVAQILWHYQATPTHRFTKMGRWKGATIKEYIREELACYSAGMSSNMKQSFKFVNVSGNTYNDVTASCLEEEYNVNSTVAAAA
jgi:hypothetical protein